MNTHHYRPKSPSGAGCDAVAPLLPLVAQRLLEPDEAQAVQAHLSGCSSCRTRLAAYDRLDDALRWHFEQLANPPIRVEELMSRVRYGEHYDRIEEPTAAPVLPAPSAPPRAARRRPRRVFSWVAAIAAVLVIALITTALVASHHAGPTTGKGHSTTNGAPPITVYGSAYNDLSSLDSTIFALDGVTGKARWTNTSKTMFRIKPFVENGVFYIGASDGSVSAYRASDGALLWSQQLLNNSVVEQVVDGVIYAGSIDEYAGHPAQHAYLYALDARTGQQLWHFTKGSNPEAVVDGTVYVAGTSDVSQQQGAIYALNTKDGSQRWEFPTQGSVKGSQVVDGQVYILVQKSGDAAFYGQMSLYAVDAGTGQARWEFPRNPAEIVSESILLGVGNGLLYVLSDEGPYSSVPPYQLYALNTGDGSVRWHEQSGPGHVQALYNNGVVYVGMDDAIAAYRASDGQRLWSNPAIHEAGPVLVANSVLYLRGGVIAVDADTGNVLWQYASGKPMLVRAVVNGLVYAITQDDGLQVDNAIYALDAANGSVRWTHDIGPDMTYYLIAK